ncbi:hypothetical protein RQP54_17630 [Curvibacter sp. APW13]|uniref:hypothetical protein n=1 Tax=Curvibacter sp. APW13 TaxID=3077236 RepID=UPI0028DD82BF|nr:hypothetical protein [Curvibacter sp. APW13]MDT8992697.1 hypothetical protein [Curvibacter sp. APW13]
MTQILNANAVLHRLSRELPAACRDQVIIVGSLAAAAQLIAGDETELRTKDIDGMIAPSACVVATGSSLATTLLERGWQAQVDTDRFAHPADAMTPDDKLPVVRLRPPGKDKDEWFLELLGAPPVLAADAQGRTRRSERVQTPSSDFEIPSFAYLGVTQFRPVRHESQLLLARVEMMALSNLLHHPSITDGRMHEPMDGLRIKRANKDLGRVIALAVLSDLQVEDVVRGWPALWRQAMQELDAPAQTVEMLRSVNAGVHQLLQSPDDRMEALHALNNGLLSSRPWTDQQLEIAIRRYLLWVE